MTGRDAQIADALREIAEQAASPRLKIEAAWRAGRRRRRNMMTASVAGAAGAVAAAALVPLAVASGNAHPELGMKGSGSMSSAARAVPLPFPPPGFLRGKSMHATLPEVQLSRVSRVVNKPCPRGSHGVPSLSHHTCYYLIGKPMHATIYTAKVVRLPGAQLSNGPLVYTIDISLARSDAAALHALTAHTLNAPSPRDQIAWIVHGVVVVSPGIQGPLPTSFQLGVTGGRAAQQQVLNEIEGFLPPPRH